MRTSEVTVVRVYITEGEHQLDNLITTIKQSEEVRGLSVFRAVAGFGPSGNFHTANFTDLSLDLPLVLEMFDEPGKMQRLVKQLSQLVKPGHMIMWSAKTNIDGKN